MSITSESWWGREIVTPELDGLFDRLCAHFDSDPMGGGTKGNAAHTTGRHRSREWCLYSAFCTDRSYGTRDQRDRDGNPRHIRAVDVKLTATQIREVSHNLDNAVRAGRAPMVAEWFGTFDNRNVVGWYEGHASSSDRSHLEHAHVGLWTIYADDRAALDRLFAIMTGDDMALDKADVETILRTDGLINSTSQAGDPATDNGFIRWETAIERDRIKLHRTDQAVAALAVKVDQILTAIKAGVVVPAQVTLTPESVAAVADATADELHADPERDGV